MRPTAIVYTSATGFTARYAALLSRQTGLPAYGLREGPGVSRACAGPGSATRWRRCALWA